jgi:hypothetical protein
VTADRLGQLAAQATAFQQFQAEHGSEVQVGASDPRPRLSAKGYDPNAWLSSLSNTLIAAISVGDDDGTDAPGGQGLSSVPNTLRLYPRREDIVDVYSTDATGTSASTPVQVSYSEAYTLLSRVSFPQPCGWRAVPANRAPRTFPRRDGTTGVDYNGWTGVLGNVTVTDISGISQLLTDKRVFVTDHLYDAARAFANPSGEGRRVFQSMSGSSEAPSGLEAMRAALAQYSLVQFKGAVDLNAAGVEARYKQIIGIAQSILRVQFDQIPNDPEGLRAFVHDLASKFFPIIQGVQGKRNKFSEVVEILTLLRQISTGNFAQRSASVPTVVSAPPTGEWAGDL